MRPNHLHLMIIAPGYTTLTTALYPKGDEYLSSDAVFGVKKSLVVVRVPPLPPSLHNPPCRSWTKRSWLTRRCGRRSTT